jgi:hypothetical protein
MPKLQDDIIEGHINYYQAKLRDIAWELYDMKSSEDLKKVANEIKAISIDMERSAEQWSLAYEKPGKEKE